MLKIYDVVDLKVPIITLLFLNEYYYVLTY